MEVIDPGHCYAVDALDGDCPQTLTFVKRQGPGYPGNVGAHPGTTSQEVLRALIDRASYVHQQVPCAESEAVIHLLSLAIYLLECRAARRHGRPVDFGLADAVAAVDKCLRCGHVGCKEGALCG